MPVTHNTSVSVCSFQLPVSGVPGNRSTLLQFLSRQVCSIKVDANVTEKHHIMPKVTTQSLPFLLLKDSDHLCEWLLWAVWIEEHDSGWHFSRSVSNYTSNWLKNVGTSVNHCQIGFTGKYEIEAHGGVGIQFWFGAMMSVWFGADWEGNRGECWNHHIKFRSIIDTPSQLLIYTRFWGLLKQGSSSWTMIHCILHIFLAIVLQVSS